MNSFKAWQVINKDCTINSSPISCNKPEDCLPLNCKSLLKQELGYSSPFFNLISSICLGGGLTITAQFGHGGSQTWSLFQLNSSLLFLPPLTQSRHISGSLAWWASSATNPIKLPNPIPARLKYLWCQPPPPPPQIGGPLRGSSSTP